MSKQKAMQKNDDKNITRDFWLRQGRQFLAIAIALFLVILPAVVYKRSDLFGELSKNTLFAFQLLVIAAFIGFTAFNWRCPSCKKYLGMDINKRACRHCGARLR
jgi:heme A synthase